MNRDSILVDTNVLVALLDAKDVLHSKAVELLRELDVPLAVLDVILGEAYSVLVRRSIEKRADPKVAIRALRNLESAMTVVATELPAIHERVIEGLLKDSSLNYNDWVLFVTARDHGMKVLTLDLKLREKLATL